MPSCTEFQRDFTAALLDPAQPAPHGLIGPDGTADALRFAVYRNNVVHSLVNALQARFPVTARLVGEKFFRSMSRLFVARHPPQSPLLMHYGDALPRFIEGFAPARPVPYLADVARLERAWSQAFHAAEAAPIAVETLAGHDAAQLERSKLRLHPSVRRLRSNHPVGTLWSAHQVPGEIATPADWQAEDLLILRPHAEVIVHHLPPGALDFTAALASGTSLGEAAEAARRRCPRFDVGQHLLGLVGLGAVTAIDPPREPAQIRMVSS